METRVVRVRRATTHHSHDTVPPLDTINGAWSLRWRRSHQHRLGQNLEVVGSLIVGSFLDGENGMENLGDSGTMKR